MNLDLVYTIIGALTVISLVAIMGGFRQVRRERLLTHDERMKAMELGRELPGDAATARIRAAFGQPSAAEERTSGSLASTCFSTPIWVAFWGFGSAAAATQGGNTGVAIAIAASVGAIGIASMICGTILAARTPAPEPSSSKPTVEEDAFDVVSCRG